MPSIVTRKSSLIHQRSHPGIFWVDQSEVKNGMGGFGLTIVSLGESVITVFSSPFFSSYDETYARLGRGYSSGNDTPNECRRMVT